MTRDTRNQDISLSFVDEVSRKKWEIKFPASFPRVGATLIENPQGLTNQKYEFRAAASTRVRQ